MPYKPSHSSGLGGKRYRCSITNEATSRSEAEFVEQGVKHWNARIGNLIAFPSLSPVLEQMSYIFLMGESRKKGKWRVRAVQDAFEILCVLEVNTHR